LAFKAKQGIYRSQLKYLSQDCQHQCITQRKPLITDSKFPVESRDKEQLHKEAQSQAGFQDDNSTSITAN
jgi:hypothetical protein